MAKIHTLKISNFRGIQSFEQTFDTTNLICLIGRGDSGKSTMLEAISKVLSPSWNLSFNDSDFYEGNISNPIEIEISLYDLPEDLLLESKFGLYKRGLDKANNEIYNELKDEHESILTIKLKVEKDLEPRWVVDSCRIQQEPVEIRASDRAKLNVFLVSDYIDRHFSWGKGTPLYSLLKNDGTSKEKTSIVIEAFRNAKTQIDADEFKHLSKVVQQIEEASSVLGAKINGPNTTIDYKDILVKDDRVSLHENKIPFRLRGKGSKRLISIAIQLELVKTGGIILIDEIEQGLEPDRVKHLVNTLKSQEAGQIFLTTHSRDVLVELEAKNICLLRKTQLFSFDHEFQGAIRNNPEAFFAKRILVCEGATEIGIMRSINKYRISKDTKSMASLGVAVADGKGANFVKYCEQFKEAHFGVCAFCDSDDKGINDKKSDLKSKSIEVIDCQTDYAIEQQFFEDLSWEAVKKLIIYAIEEKGKQSIESSVGHKITENWLDVDKSELRKVFGEASTKKGWFKRIDHGEFLGSILCEDIDNLPGTRLLEEFEQLNKWIDNA